MASQLSDEQQQQRDESTEELGLTSRVGPIEVNWPKTIGYYGGIGMALTAELIEPPLAMFIAAIPIFKLLSHPKLPKPARFTGQVLAGAAKPVGGDDEATIHLVDSGSGSGGQQSHQQSQQRQQRAGSIWSEARALADRRRSQQQLAADG